MGKLNSIFFFRQIFIISVQNFGQSASAILHFHFRQVLILSSAKEFTEIAILASIWKTCNKEWVFRLGGNSTKSSLKYSDIA